MIENRVFNFSPGPAILPEDVLITARENLLNYRASGIGVLEMSHRGKDFEEIITNAENDLRELLAVPENYAVLFTTGGASQQFSMVPMNLQQKGEQTNFILSGVWSEAALEEAKKFGETHVAASTKEEGYRRLPDTLALSSRPSYLHFTSNNTIIGSQYQREPESDAVLVCDASSDLLHKKIDVTKYGLIYAGAQKNLGPAGVTVVIIRKDLLERAPAVLPLMLDYRTFAQHRSLYNTPPTFPIYMLGLVFQWLKKLGGLGEMEKRNRAKAKVLYDAIDAGPFYEPYVETSCRSVMNVTFRLKQRDLEAEFIAAAEKKGLNGLKGHRLVGGLRASIYNAFPLEGVQALAAFMKDFSGAHG